MNELKSYDKDSEFSAEYSDWDSPFWSHGSSSAHEVFDVRIVPLTNIYFKAKHFSITDKD